MWKLSISTFYWQSHSHSPTNSLPGSVTPLLIAQQIWKQDWSKLACTKTVMVWFSLYWTLIYSVTKWNVGSLPALVHVFVSRSSIVVYFSLVPPMKRIWVILLFTFWAEIPGLVISSGGSQRDSNLVSSPFMMVILNPFWRTMAFLSGKIKYWNLES